MSDLETVLANSEVDDNYVNPIQQRITNNLEDPTFERFKLDPTFVGEYSQKPSPFGFNGLGELAYIRTYSRIQEDGSNEGWHETVQRVVEGAYNMQKRHVLASGKTWIESKAQASAQEMYDRMWNMKFLPPGRGLWGMGSAITEERGLYAALNNCAFVSTKNIKEDLAKPFTFLMDMSMLGVGVGFDTRGAGTMVVPGTNSELPTELYEIPDTREGWVESLRLKLESYLAGNAPITFNYDKIRPRGELIKGFGGKSSGPGPLKDLHERLDDILEEETGKDLSARTIVDIQNLIGQCVVAGNVRRTAEISLGEASDEEYLDLKDYEKNPERAEFGWTSNNSVFAELGMDYSEIAKRTAANGEPGFIWLDNMRKFGRMGRSPDHKDAGADGVNPCVEQTLWNYELCNLVETFPDRHENVEDFKRTLKFAYLYGKTVTLGQTHWPETNEVMAKNRRIGCSMSGIAQFLGNKGIEELRKWSEEGYDTIQYYDEVYSDWLGIPRSIKTTSIKPSGTVSLLAGSTPGVHYPISQHYIRRMRLANDSNLIDTLKDSGYNVEPSVDDKSSVVVDFPISLGDNIRALSDVSMWEQLELSAFMQRHWADNQVSSTVTFDPHTEGNQIANALNFYQYELKGISFLPGQNGNSREGQENTKPYAQMPYEPISKEAYDGLVKDLKPLDFSKVKGEQAIPEKGCDGDKCVL